MRLFTLFSASAGLVASLFAFACGGASSQDDVFGLEVAAPEAQFGVATEALSANADLGITMSGPSSAPTGSSQAYSVTVRNYGNPKANNVVVLVTLPAGATLGATGGGCAADSNPLRVRCAWSAINAGTYKTGTFSVVVPSAAGAANFSATGTTSSVETALANNTGRWTTNLYTVVAPVPVTLTLPQTIDVSDCFGSSTTSTITNYADCTPAWMMYAQFVLEANGSVNTGTPTVSGTWSQPTGPASLQMVFRNATSGAVVSTFNGTGVSSTCFEGPVLPGSPNIPRGAFRACTLP